MAGPESASGSTTTTLEAPPTSAPTGPSIASLPQGCAVGTPASNAVVTFVADGRAWAVAPDDPATLTCLFETADAGQFSWGPQGDRVLLSGLEVRGVGADVSRPITSVRTAYFSWSRPTGTTVVFSDPQQRSISRADMGSSGTRDITPLPDMTFGDMAYHPSGLAIGFVAEAADGTQSIWMSTNTGTDPQVLVQASGPESSFEHIVFAHDGLGLFYTLDRTDGTHAVERYDLTTGDVEEVASFAAPVHEVFDTPGLPLSYTVGAACADRSAETQVAGGSGSPLRPIVVDAPGPASIIGRLDQDHFVVEVGGCDAPGDLYVANAATGGAELLVRSVEAAAMRTPEPTPAPALPQRLPRSGFA